MDFTQDVEHCLQILRAGGLILYPTDTVWGIGCDATNAIAVQKIYELKQRPEAKSMIALLAHERDLLQYVSGPDPEIFDFLKTVSKPTTVVYKGAIGFAENVISSEGTVAIRIVKDNFCKHLIKRFRKPIVSTSANVSGEPAPRIFKEISPVIKRSVDYIVQYRQEDELPAVPSAVIKWEHGKAIVLRD